MYFLRLIQENMFMFHIGKKRVFGFNNNTKCNINELEMYFFLPKIHFEIPF